MFKYFEINKNHHNIRCKIFSNDINNIKKIIIFCHGFAGHKDNKTAEKFADRVLSKNKDIALLIFNWPGHGDDVKKKIRLNDCCEYLDMVLQYAKETFNPAEIFCCGTSFGGYLVLRYISLNGNPFEKIALRCPAINMFEVLSKTLMTADEEKRKKKGKSVSVGFDRKVEIDGQFLDELKESDIRGIEFFDYADDILIIHGTADEIVPFEVSSNFADDNCIEFISVEGADHRFQNPQLMEISTKAIIRFFGLK